MKLQSLTMLSDADPIHRYLGIVDRFLGEHDWLDTHRGLPKEELARGVFGCLGHPKLYNEVDDRHIDNFEDWLRENGEPVLAEILNKLRRRVGQDGLTNDGVRLVMIWLIANILHLKDEYLEEQQHRPNPRRITTGWETSQK